jgi:hypothetical protein
MFDWRRYRGTAAAGGLIGSALILLNFALLLGLGKAPTWLVPPRRPLGWSEVERADRRAGETSRVRPEYAIEYLYWHVYYERSG